MCSAGGRGSRAKGETSGKASAGGRVSMGVSMGVWWSNSWPRLPDSTSTASVLVADMVATVLWAHPLSSRCYEVCISGLKAKRPA